jgi:tRNA A-37 threonylcarbamoyl transferase component Bud32
MEGVLAVDSESTGLLGGRYHLGRELGRGGAATVHEAADVLLGRAVAVKRFRVDGNTSTVYRFGVEARLLANLSHPGLVTVYDVCLDGDRPYLVLQLVNGTTLRKVIDDGPLEPDVVARLGARLADVLAYIHSCDVVHRDLKPSNVLLDKAGVCYLADFGVARALSAAHLTASDEFVGTVAYLAPEQVTDADTGHAVDVYALGLVLLECLTGRTEYTGTTAEAAVARLSRRPRVPSSLDPGWRTVLTAMTERDPADRPTAARCAELLSALAEDRQVTRTFVALPRRPKPVHVALTVAALAAVAALVMPGVIAPASVPGRPVGEPMPTPLTDAAESQETTPPAVGAPGTAQAEPPPADPPPADPPPAAAQEEPEGGGGPGPNQGRGQGEGKDKNKGKN